MESNKLSPEEVERRGEEIYARDIRDALSPDDKGKFVVLDVITGDYELDSEHLAAIKRMLNRHENGDAFYSLRVGFPTAYQIGGIAHLVTP